MIPKEEVEAARIRRDAKRQLRQQPDNYVLPVLKIPPFRTSLTVGTVVRIRSIISGGENPLYYNDDGWTVVGYRHDEKTSRQELFVLSKDGREINMDGKDIFLS